VPAHIYINMLAYILYMYACVHVLCLLGKVQLKCMKKGGLKNPSGRQRLFKA